MLMRSDIKILLIEARLDQAMIDHEKACILRAGKLAPEQVVPFDILPHGPQLDIADGYDAVILGGTGDYSVVQDQIEFYQPLLAFARHLLEVGKPTLGLCYGHQIIAQACGGVVETHHDREETGTYIMELTEAGTKDPILKQLPHRFPAQQGHHDMVMNMPKDFVRLAFSERCAWQGMRHITKPMYSFQFHPELTRPDLVQRMMTYADVYASEPGKLDKILEAIKDTDVQSVIEKFIDEVVVKQA